jgi:hypothetical protein
MSAGVIVVDGHVLGLTMNWIGNGRRPDTSCDGAVYDPLLARIA